MNQIQIHSVAKVFDRPGVLQRMMTLMSRVAAMGLLPKSRRIETLDEDAFRLVLKSLQSGNLIGGRSPALSRIMTPAFAQSLVFCKLTTRAVSVTAPLSIDLYT